VNSAWVGFYNKCGNTHGATLKIVCHHYAMQLSPSSSLQTASSFCGIEMLHASSCQWCLVYSSWDLWKPL